MFKATAGALLNFEQSINAELEAELLTGKQLNLERARAAALNNDMATLAEELKKQNVDLASFGQVGWPVLPHGGGTFYNMFGRYIGAVPTSGNGFTYGEYIPGTTADVSGEILCAAVNYQNNSNIDYHIYVANYGVTSSFGSSLIGIAGPSSSGSLETSFTVGRGISIAPKDYIGIYVEDPEITNPPNTPPKVMIEGTVYFSLH